VHNLSGLDHASLDQSAAARGVIERRYDESSRRFREAPLGGRFEVKETSMKIDGEPLTDQALRKVRGLFASGVTVVTTVHEGQLRGVTVSAFASVSLHPPLVLICLANESESREWIAGSGVFAVNVLSDEQEFLSERFAARAPIVNTRFEGVPYHTAMTGSPILADSLAWYDCRVEAAHDGGDHTIFVGRVAAIGFGPEGKQPLLYFANRYQRLGS
jgi:flavin reductase (DIM6/NTAB) family NADH-FMN oxidoreductase RutF